jgi:hypothetical protein
VSALPGNYLNAPESRDYLPPLLRGIGTTLILIGTVVAFVSARRDIEHHRAKRQSFAPIPAYSSQPTLDLVAKELQDLRAETLNENLAEEIVENRWFEWLGVFGAGVASASFYVEALMRRSKRLLR